MALPSKDLSDKALDALITREQTRVVAPLTEWQNLSMALHQEGIIRDGTDARGQRRPAEPAYTGEPKPRGNGWIRTTGRWTARLAASAVLVGAGVLAGRGMTFGQDIVHQIQLATADSTGSTAVHVSGGKYASPADARKALVRAETDYQRASAFLAASDSDSGPRIAASPSTYQDRLAGLDQMTAASLSALKGAPQDPILNQYFLSATAARQATLTQLGNALPVGARMESF